MDPTNINSKRSFDEAFPHQDAGLPFSPDKKQKTKERSFLVFPTAVQNIIFSYLDYKDLLAFEGASTEYRNLTDYSWKLLCEQYGYMGDFRACEKDPHKNKWNFCLWAALVKYVTIELFAKERPRNPLKWANGISQRYQGIMDRFPCLGVYIKPTLYQVLTSTLPYPTDFQDERAAILEGALAGCGGDLTLQGLLEYSSRTYSRINSPKLTCHYLKRAIEKNAAQAFLLYSILGSVSGTDEHTRFSPLLSLKLERLVWEKGGEGLQVLTHYNQLIGSGKILFNNEKITAELQSPLPAAGQTLSPKRQIYQAIMKYRLNQVGKAEVIFDQAISSYGASVPDFALSYAGFAKMKNLRFKEADARLSRVVNPPDKHLPAFVLEDAGDVKRNLLDWPEAERLYERAIKAYGNKVPAVTLANAAIVKFNLSKWIEANALFTQSIKAYGDNVPAVTLANAGAVKKYLGERVEAEKKDLSKWVEADDLYTRAIKAYGDNVPAITLANAGAVKKHLGERAEAEKKDLSKLAEADDLFTRAIKAYGDKVTAITLANAGAVKKRLGERAEAEKKDLSKLAEADDLFTRAIKAYGNKVTAITLANAGGVKISLEKWVEADEFYTRAIKAYGDKVPAATLKIAATMKSKLSKWAEADDLFTQVLKAEGDSVSASALAVAGRVKIGLEKWAEADELYTRAIKADGNGIYSVTLAEAGRVKRKLNKWTDADELCTQAIKAYRNHVAKFRLTNAKRVELYTKIIKAFGDDVPAFLLKEAAIAKSELEKTT